MRITFSYFISCIFGIASALIFHNIAFVNSAFTNIAKLAYNLGSAIFILMIIFSLPAAVASLKKDKIFAKANSTNALVIFKFAITLPVVAAVLVYFLPLTFPTTSTSTLASNSEAFVSSVLLNLKTLVFDTSNVFTLLNRPYTIALPLIVVAIAFGLAITPSTDVVKPAYVVANSFSEVMYRLSKVFTMLSFIFVYFISYVATYSLITDATIFTRLDFLLYVLAFVAVAYFVITPLVFVVFSRGKLNPYKKRYFALSLFALISGSTTYTAVINMNIARNNLGIQKRISSYVTLLNSVFLKGGTAAIATIIIFSLLHSYGTFPTSIMDICIILTFIIMSSFISSAAYNTELLFTVFFALKLANINLYGAEMAILGIVALLNGFALMLDSQISVLSSALVAVNTNTDIEVAKKDLI